MAKSNTPLEQKKLEFVDKRGKVELIGALVCEEYLHVLLNDM